MTAFIKRHNLFKTMSSGLGLGMMMIAGLLLGASCAHSPDEGESTPAALRGCRGPLAAGGDRFAVVIGVSDYRHDVRAGPGAGLTDLRFAHRDGEAIVRFLISPSGGGFATDHVLLLTDGRAASGEVRKALNGFLSRSRKGDLVMIFFSGHILADPLEPGAFYLACHDTQPGQYAKTAFSLGELAGALTGAIPSRQVFVFLDGFRSPAVGGADLVSPAGDFNKALERIADSREGVTFISSSGKEGFSEETTDLGGGHGVFSFYLLEGLGGRADQNRDGCITIAELFAYLREQVQAQTHDVQRPWASAGAESAIALRVIDPQGPVPVLYDADNPTVSPVSQGLPSGSAGDIPFSLDSQTLLNLSRARMAKDDLGMALDMADTVIRRKDGAAPDALALKIAILLQQGDLAGAEMAEDFLVVPYAGHPAADEGARLIFNHYVKETAGISPEEGSQRMDTYLKRHPNGLLQNQARQKLDDLQRRIGVQSRERFEKSLALAKNLMDQRQFDPARDELNRAEQLARQVFSQDEMQGAISRIAALRADLEGMGSTRKWDEDYHDLMERTRYQADEERIPALRSFLEANPKSPYAKEVEVDLRTIQDAYRAEVQTRYDRFLSDAQGACAEGDLMRCEKMLDAADALYLESEDHLGIVLERGDEGSQLRGRMTSQMKEGFQDWEGTDREARAISLSSPGDYDRRLAVYRNFLKKWPMSSYRKNAEEAINALNRDKASFRQKEFQKHFDIAVRYFEKRDFKKAYQALDEAKAIATKEELARIEALAKKANSPPEVSIILDRETVEWDEPVRFSFKAVDKEGDPIEVKEWDFSDGGTSKEAAPEHAYSEWSGPEKERHYQITLTVTDSFNEATATRTIVVKRPESTQTVTVNGVSFRMKRIPKGGFTMGSPQNEKGSDDDETQHPVHISASYWMGETEVTQGLWKAVMGDNPSGFPRCGDNCPVEQVSWDDCQEFLRRLNGTIPGAGFRLPTEAEWEYACRAGSRTAFSHGDIKDVDCGHDPGLDGAGWYCANAGHAVHPAAGKRPNPWGLYDMHGNVYEWCDDWYGKYPPGTAIDPKGSPSGSYRVLRGGSWDSTARDCRSANRRGARPGDRHNDLGLRLARDRVTP